MKQSVVRSFSSVGRFSRTSLWAGATLVAAAAVTGAVAARTGTGDERGQAIGTGRQVLAAVESWRSQNGDTGCPTITMLVDDEALDREARTDDPWGNRFRIVCDGERTRVLSAGPDGRSGTPDDVTVEGS
jgi:hypothetical protein